jgi:hypothetical protein
MSGLASTINVLLEAAGYTYRAEKIISKGKREMQNMHY